MNPKILPANALQSPLGEKYWHLLLLALLVVAPLPIGVLIWDLVGGENNRKQLAEFGREITPLNIVTPDTRTPTSVATDTESDFEHFPVYVPVPPAFDYTVAAVYNSDIATEESEPPSEGPGQASATGPTAGSTSTANVSGSSSSATAPNILGSDTSSNPPARPTGFVQAIPEGSSAGVLFALGLAALFGLSICQRKRAKPPLSRS